MLNRLSYTLRWLVAVIVLVGSGCARRHIADTSASKPDVAERVLAGTYAPRAIKAAGGYQSWIKTKKLELDCIVTFYNPDGSFYLTEQHHEICPWLNSAGISAQEPEGKLLWQLSGEDFRAVEGDEQFYPLPTPINARDFAEAVLYITTAPIRFLDSKAEFEETLVPIRMEGLWYYPIERVVSNLKPYWSQVVLYQSKDTSFVDMLWFADIDGDRYLSVRGYDYSKVEKRAVLVPAEIEIFKTNSKGVLQQRLVKIDYYSLTATE